MFDATTALLVAGGAAAVAVLTTLALIVAVERRRRRERERAAERARGLGRYTLARATIAIDPGTGSPAELKAAYDDCWRCVLTEWPASPEQSGVAAAAMVRIEEAAKRRFPPDQARSILGRGKPPA